MHDSSACITRDGELLHAVAEERISRDKHDSGFPTHAIQACLDQTGISPDEVDHVCLSWPSPAQEYKADLQGMMRGRMPFEPVEGFLSLFRLTDSTGGKQFYEQQIGPVSSFRYTGHHRSHAISAYAYSGFDEATIVVFDGRGAWESTSIWKGENGQLRRVEVIPWPNSLGLLYAEFTAYLGFRRYNDEWKVMGLAPYGEPGVDLSPFFELTDEGYEVAGRQLLENKGDAIPAEYGVRAREHGEPLDDWHRNVAHALQEACTDGMKQVVETAVRKTGCSNVCMAGGVALNSKANGVIATTNFVDDIFIQPAAADDGAALGAALAPYLDLDGGLPISTMRDPYLGDGFSDKDIEETLSSYQLSYQSVEDPAVEAAERLADGQIVGWFQGRMEFGPRALGNRSILGDPSSESTKDRINKAVKFRESWRPFAPSILEEYAGEYLANIEHSPFMILTDQATEKGSQKMPAAIHVDGSTRPQTVEKDVNPRYWRLIDQFRQRTGVPVVLNTSFNLRGEPIVRTPTDAVRTFFSSGMDTLVIGGYVVEKTG
ncbi:carbamoyltransferase family protein [Salinibacter ruber]|uniref:Carbamoyltransferase n=1 Tax=Salinibacter ruber TaxID=146919 RepID=A0A9X2QG67_9BACT|nr:carbamoyltransferase [Salinibacter ruber]MCS3711888.1 carbamoyltransferase [Salinibacter ruber]